MCGIIGLMLADEKAHVNQLLFDGLTVLQHRGQDAAGMVTSERGRLHLRKDNGLVRDVFQQHHMLELRGNVGVGHVRYPTAGSSSCAEAQPLYTNYPYGICVAHNGNLTNTEALYKDMATKLRHVNTDSDSELLLNLFAESLNKHQSKQDDVIEAVFDTCKEIMYQCKGGYATVYYINGVGLVGFRDSHGIRPLVFGCRSNDPEDTDKTWTTEMMETAGKKLDYCVASESVAIDTLGFQLVRDVRAGEAIFIDMNTGNCHMRLCVDDAAPAPCIFEYVYFARPDSIMDGVSVYEARLHMGIKLAEKIKRVYPDHGIDVVIPIPDTSRTSALQVAYTLDRPFREGFIKNRYIARTFIMPGQASRKKSVRLKLNTIKSEFAGKNVLLVDDSIVRGTTANEIVQMARDAGAKKVFFSSCAPPIRYPNIYGIDIPTREELIAFERVEEEIAAKIGCDWVVYQDLKDLEDSVLEVADPEVPLTAFDTSCFSGEYVTGECIGDSYFTKLYDLRNEEAKTVRNGNKASGDSGSKAKQSNEGCETVSNDIRESTRLRQDSILNHLTQDRRRTTERKRKQPDSVEHDSVQVVRVHQDQGRTNHCTPIGVQQLMAGVRSKKRGLSCQVCSFEGRGTNIIGNVVACAQHRVRACTLTREDRNLKQADGSDVIDYSWRASMPGASCWDKIHKFYIPHGLFRNDVEPMNLFDEKTTFQCCRLSCKLYIKKREALGETNVRGRRKEKDATQEDNDLI